MHPVVIGIECRIISRILTAECVLKEFMDGCEFNPSRGYPRLVSPAFSTNTLFMNGTLEAIKEFGPCTWQTLLVQANNTWEHDMTEKFMGVYLTEQLRSPASPKGQSPRQPLRTPVLGLSMDPAECPPPPATSDHHEADPMARSEDRQDPHKG
jgi:hypothetical protein